MVPDTTSAILVFLVFVAPGIAFQLLRAGSRPEAEASVFRETSLVVLTSLLFSFGSVMLLSGVRAVAPSFMPDPGAWMAGGQSYVQANYRLVAIAVVSELVLALGLALGAHRVLDALAGSTRAMRWGDAFYGKGRRIRPMSIWFQLFGRQRRAGEHVFLTVETTSGDAYSGFLVAYTVDDCDPAERELLLGPPLRLTREGATAELDGWHRLVVPGAQIASILATYTREPARTA